MTYIATDLSSIWVDLVGEDRRIINVAIGNKDIDLSVFDAEELIYLLNKAIDEAKRNGAEY
jgi:hypothetical protein